MMTDILRPVTALLMAAAILMTGNGLLGVLVPIRADLAKFSGLEIGAMGSLYYAGLMIGCLIAPAIIARVGHIRAFTAFTASATITPLLHAMWLDPWVWAGLRGLNGLCFAGLFMGIESWLSGASTSETRGRVLAAYTVINLTVVTLGMQMLALTPPGGFELFSLVAILYSLAAVPVCLTTTPVPSAPKRAKLRIGWLFSVSPVSVLGCFFTGIANSGFWQLSALYASQGGLSIADVALFVTIAVLGGAIGQWPVGMISDKFGRRPLLMVCGIAAASAGLALFAAGQVKPPLLLLFAFAAAYGLMAFPIYTLCVAHANDLVHKKRAVEVSSGLLLVFSVGAVIGPLLASAAMAGLGHGALFLHTAIAHLLIAVVAAVRSQVRPSLPNRRQEDYVVVPNSTPAMFELDPRGAEKPQQEAANQDRPGADRQKPAA